MRKMKPSGVEWIGDIPQEWEVSRIGYLFSERKVKVSDKEYEPLSVTMQGIVPQLSTAAKTDAHDDRKLVCNGDFVINSRSDRRGSCGISKYDGSVSLINIVLKPRIEISQQYYNWLFKSSAFSDEFYKWGHGIVDDLWTTNWQDMKHIYISLLPLPEQQRIAEFLDRKCAEIDSVISKTKATIEQYKSLKQSVITQAVTKGIRLDRPMKDSGDIWIGLIPEDVKLSRTGLHFNIVLGKMLCTDPIDDSYTYEYYYCAANVHFGELSNDGLKQMWFSEKEKQQYLVNAGDLLVVEGGAGAGGCCLVPSQENKTYIQNSIMIVRGKNSNCTGYLRYLIEFLVKSGYVDIVCNKATIPHFTKEKLAAVPFPLFSPIEQQEIADYLDRKCSEIDRLIAAKEQLLTELESYKKSVIYEYVTGKKEI